MLKRFAYVKDAFLIVNKYFKEVVIIVLNCLNPLAKLLKVFAIKLSSVLLKTRSFACLQRCRLVLLV